MSQIQQNGNNVTGNYFQGTSTKNKGGSIIAGGVSANETSLKPANSYVGVFGSIVANSSILGNTASIPSGNFAHNHIKPLSAGTISELAGLDYIFKAGNPGGKDPNKLESIITNNIYTSFRNNRYNLYTNKYNPPISSQIDNFGIDKSIGINNKTTYQVGNNKLFGNKTSENTISAPPSVTPTPTVTVSASPNGSIPPTTTPTATTTPTPSSSPAVIIMSNSANYNNCAGNLANVGTSGRSSYYGAYDMSGNIWEWLETSVGPYNKVLRGGNLIDNSSYIASTSRSFTDKSFGNSLFGFRIASKTVSSLYPNVVVVGDINNIADSSGYGSVDYQYYIGTYEITNSNYIEFLNSIAQTDTNNIYDPAMGWSNLGGITRSGSQGNYVYTTKTNMGNKPVNFLNWASCARYCNWLCNNKPTGLQNNTTTENGAYNMSLADPSRDSNANFFIPNENEWYKAAYYKGGSTNAGYWIYATQSNTAPNCVQLTVSGDGIPV